MSDLFSDTTGYSSMDQKQICNVLEEASKILNKYNNIPTEIKNSFSEYISSIKKNMEFKHPQFNKGYKIKDGLSRTIELDFQDDFLELHIHTIKEVNDEKKIECTDSYIIYNSNIFSLERTVKHKENRNKVLFKQYFIDCADLKERKLTKKEIDLVKEIIGLNNMLNEAISLECGYYSSLECDFKNTPSVGYIREKYKGDLNKKYINYLFSVEIKKGDKYFTLKLLIEDNTAKIEGYDQQLTIPEDINKTIQNKIAIAAKHGINIANIPHEFQPQRILKKSTTPGTQGVDNTEEYGHI